MSLHDCLRKCEGACVCSCLGVGLEGRQIAAVGRGAVFFVPCREDGGWVELSSLIGLNLTEVRGG